MFVRNQIPVMMELGSEASSSIPETSHSRLWPIGREMLEFYRQDMIRILETLY